MIEELGARRRPRGPCRAVDGLDLQRCEDTLSDGVVLAIAAAAHAADDPVLRQHPLVVAARVLTLTIRMMQAVLHRTRRWNYEARLDHTRRETD